MSTPIDILLQTTIEPTDNRVEATLPVHSVMRDVRGIDVSPFRGLQLGPGRGSPDFVSETPGYTLANTPRAVASVHCYVRNVALWLAGKL